MWNFKILIATQIFCEINYGHFMQKLKNDYLILAISEAMIFYFIEFLTPGKQRC